jgi:DNA helicase-2/ATP-dependent DNA helicase PcrA
VVGDFAQSIYAWRGADYRNMMLLKQDFHPISEYKLEQNYRSTQTILDAATQVISHNTAHPILELWTDNPKAEPITLIEAATGEGEAKEVVNRIRKLQDSGYGLKDIAILYRTNAQSRPFEEAFIRAGMPYTLVGGFKFYERKEIKDALAYVRLYLNPTDSVSRERLSKLGKRKLAAFEVWSEHHQQQAATQPAGSPLTPHQLLTEILATTKFFEQFDTHDPEDVARIDNVNELLNVAAQFDDIAVMLENIALVQDDYMADAEGKENGESVTMMSLHSAKGLEFPVVFMVGMEEGLLPHSRSIMDKEQMEEERRLCYVGITRAKEKLFLTHARQRWTYGTSSYAVRSRFIADIPSSLIKEEAAADAHANTTTNYRGSYGSQSWSKRWNDEDTQDTQDYQAQQFIKKTTPKTVKPSASAVTRRLILDDDQLDAFLKGEIDTKAYLDN